MKKRKCALFLQLITIGFLLYPAPGRDVIRIGIPTFPGSLNPVYATAESSQAILNKVFDSLYCYDFKGRIIESLVKTADVKYNAGKMEIVFELKKNIFFSNGKELQSEDVIRTVKLMQNNSYNYPYLSVFRRITGIEKIDRLRFKIRMIKQLASWKNYLTFKILNSDEIKNVTPELFRHMKLSGTGPYKFKSIDEPRKVVLELNELSTPKSEKIPGDESMYRYIEYTVLSYTNLAPLKLLNNEIDICELQPENVDAYKNTPTWKEKFDIMKYKKYGYTYLVFNLKNPIITQNVREIFYNRLTEGKFLDHFLENRGERVMTPFLQLNPGIPIRRSYIQPLTKEIRLRILTNTESKLRKEFVLFLKQEMKTYNIILEPVFLEYQTFLKYLKNGGCDIAVSGYMLNIDYDMKEIFGGNSYFNYAHFQSGEMESLLEQALIEMNPQNREKIYVKAHNLWMEKLPFIPIFNLYYYVGVSKKIQVPAETCSLVGADGDFLINIRQWRFKTK
jgi:ABC-type transport system substrate-binding protein